MSDKIQLIMLGVFIYLFFSLCAFFNWHSYFNCLKYGEVIYLSHKVKCQFINE
jgi:hypothetical protein